LPCDNARYNTGMRVLIIGKYPPIEGGVSARTYWLAHALAERDIEVSVVTNAGCVEESYRETLNLSNPATQEKYSHPNLKIFSLEGKSPRHIPYSETYVSRLVNLALGAIEVRRPDIIFAHYLEPYGTAGYFVKKMTGLPFVIQHAGSDIYRLLQHEDFYRLLGRVIAESDGAFLGPSLRTLAEKLGMRKEQLLERRHFGVPPAFAPKGEPFAFGAYGLQNPPAGIPIITYMGKAGKNKGIAELFSALRNISADFRLLFISKGEQMETVETFLAENPSFAERVLRPGFLPPWEIPSVLRSSTLLTHLEHLFPIPIHSPVQPYEAVACGTPLLLSGEIFAKIRRRFPKTASRFSVVDDPADIPALQAALEKSLVEPERMREDAAAIREEFTQSAQWDRFVDDYVQAFARVAKKRRRFARLRR